MKTTINPAIAALIEQTRTRRIIGAIYDALNTATRDEIRANDPEAFFRIEPNGSEAWLGTADVHLMLKAEPGSFMREKPFPRDVAFSYSFAAGGQPGYSDKWRELDGPAVREALALYAFAVGATDDELLHFDLTVAPYKPTFASAVHLHHDYKGEFILQCDDRDGFRQDENGRWQPLKNHTTVWGHERHDR